MFDTTPPESPIGADELFELCKAVYEATGWEMPKSSRNRYVVVHGGHMNSIVKTKPTAVGYSPLYTSDYLLEKLPRYINEATNELLLARWGTQWRACYMPIDLGHYPTLREQADTPLKALLKLTLALNEADLLTPNEKE